MQPAQNRAIALWKSWEEKEKMLLDVFGQDKGFGNFSREKYDFLSAGLDRISPLSSPDEKLVAGLIRKSLGKLERQLYPNRFFRIVQRIKRIGFDRPVAALKFSALRKSNIAVLDAGIAKLGIDTIRLDLAKSLDYEQSKMDLQLSSPIGLDRGFEIVLHLMKDDLGRFVLDGFSGKLKNGLDSALDRSFRFDAGMAVSTGAALNLLEGRAVLAGGDLGERRWMQLDFGISGAGVVRELGSLDGFSLSAQLEKMAEDLKRPELLQGHIARAMEQGNQVVVMRATGEKLFLEAAPFSGKVVVRDGSQMVVALGKVLKKRGKSLGLNAELKISRTKQRQQGQALGIA